MPNDNNSLIHPNRLIHYPDPIVQDSKLSAYISALCILFVLLMTKYALGSWVYTDNVLTLHLNYLEKTIELFATIGSLFTIVFWCSHPTCKIQWAVILIWFILLFFIGQMHRSDTLNQHIILGLLAISCSLILLLRISGLLKTTESTLYENRLKWLVLSMSLLIIPIYPALMLGKLFNEKTFDLFALNFDILISPTWVSNLTSLIDSIPGAPTILYLAYGATPIGLLTIAILQLRGRPLHVASALLVWVAAGPLALLAYHFFPITGPSYVFNSIDNAYLHPNLYPIDMTSPLNGARNGMPSMHLGWMLAASILCWQSSSNPYLRAILIIQTGFVLLATLYLGEHYMIDLIVSVPFTLSLIALCTTTISIRYAPRQHVIFAGFLTWLVWVILLRTQLTFFMANPWAAKSLVVLSMMVASWQTYLLSTFNRGVVGWALAQHKLGAVYPVGPRPNLQ